MSDVGKARIVLDDQSFQSIWLGAWSPDGRSIALVVRRKGGERELSLVNVASGAMRGLKRIGSRRVSRMEFSPDGKHLIYDLGAAAVDRDIFAMQIVDGNDGRLVGFAGNDTFAGFSPDGRRIVFSSLRAGTPGLWTADYADGAISNLQLVKPDIAIDSTFGITPAGALYYVADTRGISDVKMAEFDVRTGRFTSAPVDIPADLMGVNSAPALSPDGKSVAYLTQRRSDGQFLVVRPVGAGASRTFRIPLQFRNSNGRLWNWTADSSGFYAVGTSNVGVDGIHRIDATTGEISWTLEAPLRVMLPAEVGSSRLRYAEPRGGRPDGVFILREWEIDARRGREVYRSNDDCRMAPDGGDTVYCVRGTSIVRRDVMNGADVPLAEYEPGRAWTVSPDQRVLVTYRSGAGRTDRSMWVTDLASGGTRRLATGERNFFVMWWAPDSKAVVATVGNPQESRETWWIPVDGAKPHKMEELSGLRLAGPGAENRRGQFAHGRFVFGVSSPSTPTELSVLEHFLPPTPKKSGSRP